MNRKKLNELNNKIDSLEREVNQRINEITERLDFAEYKIAHPLKYGKGDSFGDLVVMDARYNRRLPMNLFMGRSYKIQYSVFNTATKTVEEISESELDEYIGSVNKKKK